MISCRFSLSRPLQALLLAGILAVGTAQAQDFRSMGISAVLAVADSRLQSGDFEGAINPLIEVIKRTEDVTDPTGMETLQTCRFQLARAYYQTDSIDYGVDVLEDYVENEPRKKERMALRMLANGYFQEQEWDKIQEMAERLLSLPKLSETDLYYGNRFLGVALFRKESWEACIEPLTYAGDNAEDEFNQRLCHIMVVHALTKAERWVDLYDWIPRLYRTEAKYDITLNVTLMEAGKARYEEGDNLNALQLYRMVLPRTELVKHAKQTIYTMTKKLEADMKVGITPEQISERKRQIGEVQTSLETLDGVGPYEDEVTYRIGQIYYDGKRFWEGFVLFDKLYRQGPTNDVGQGALAQSVQILYDVKEVPRAEQRILKYIEDVPNATHARSLTQMLMYDRLAEQDAPDKVVALQSVVEQMPPTDDIEERQTQSRLHYMLGFGHMRNKDYKDGGEQFNVIVENYPNSPVYADALYYRGMAKMFQAEFQPAKDDFNAYLVKYQEGDHIAASKFRSSYCDFGLEDVVAAEEGFTAFVAEYPDHAHTSDAYSLRGDIRSAKDSEDVPDALDQALADYRMALELAKEPPQAAYPVFKAAEVYELEYKWEEVVQLMEYYMNRWEEMANVAKALFWIGQAQINLGNLDAALDAYVDGIKRFGNDRDREGVDLIMVELAKIATEYLSEEGREELIARLNSEFAEVDEREEVLKLRIQVMTAMLAGEKQAVVLGKELIANGQDLELASALVLSVMCDAAVESGNAEEMERLYTYFMEKYDESKLAWHAFRAKIYKEKAAGNLEGVITWVEEVQSMFGQGAEYLGWAQLLLADTLLELNRYEESAKAYQMIAGVPEWRGALSAQGTLGMAKAYAGQGDLGQAYAFYQRVYLLFKSYDDGLWAAKGYLGAAQALLDLGRTEDAVKTWNAMLDDQYVAKHPLAKDALKMLKKYGGQ